METLKDSSRLAANRTAIHHDSVVGVANAILCLGDTNESDIYVAWVSRPLSWLLYLLSAKADAVPPDANYATDLQAANADRHYSHILDETQRVYIYRLHNSSALFRLCDKKYTGALECSVKEMSEIETQPIDRTCPRS